MSDLGNNGRIAATNGGASRLGPVPAPQGFSQPPPITDPGRSATGSPGRAGMKTPRTIMAERAERQRREEARLQEQEVQAQQELARAQQFANAPGGSGITGPAPRQGRNPGTVGPARNVTDDSGYGTNPYPSRQQTDRTPGMGPLPNPPPIPPQPQSRNSRVNPGSEPRPVPSQIAGPGAQRTQPLRPTGQTQPSTGATSQPRPRRQTDPEAEAGPSNAGAARERSTQSSFPHAFERWEDLSSHWEGLTSFWIHKLEHDAEEVSRIPLGQQMSRQITDLAAAGANLFHAVVELQRLRASSERKFSRWFIETRRDMERAAEVNAELERQLAQARAQPRLSDGQIQEYERRVQRAERVADEARRELAISKNEAGRAWEELGRREQEEREHQQALRDGMPILIGGVEVYPTMGGASRQASLSQRPTARDSSAQQGQYPQVPAAASQYVGQHQPYVEDSSPTDTDPFTDPRHQQQPQQQQYGMSPYVAGATPATSSASARTMIPVPASQSQSRAGVAAQQRQPQALYSHPATSAEQAYIPVSAAGLPERESASYVETPSNDDDILSASDELGEHEEEWEIDSEGNIRQDASGRPIPWRRGLRSSTVEGAEDDEDDVRDDIQRERMLARQYGAGQQQASAQPLSGVTYPSIPASSAAAMAQTAGATAGMSTTRRAVPFQQAGLTVPGAPMPPPPQPRQEYEGEGSEDDEYDQEGNWDTMRHHHPTRLSDVMEEDERSRTTAE